MTVPNERLSDEEIARLLPCPFCGGQPNYDDSSDFVMPETSKWGRVQCPQCGAQGGDVRTQYQDFTHWRDRAAEEWNRRDAPQTLRELLIRISAHLDGTDTRYSARELCDEIAPWVKGER